jgi:hypothetical protein
VARSTSESLALSLGQAISCSSLDQQQAMEEWLGGAVGSFFKPGADNGGWASN